MEEFDKCKEEVKNKIINSLVNYVREGIFPKIDQNLFLECYTLIQKLTNRGNYCENLFNLHNEVIEQTTTECYEKIKDVNGIEFIDYFILCTDRLSYLILIMSNLFSYLSMFYLPVYKGKNELSEFSMDIYKQFFFNKLQNKLFTLFKELNNLEVKDDNINNKINSIMKIIYYMDFVNPKIIRNSKTSADWIENSREQKQSPIIYQKMWEDFKNK